MSYLDLPRIVFTGDFISDVSTVNNDIQHYNNETFKPSFQKERTKNDMNGWWNPEGGATFGFKDCTVQKVTYSDGSLADDSELNSLLGEIVTGAEGRSVGKMVDLDPQQQMVSQLWAVQLRILNAKGEVLLVGDLAVTAFRDLQMRQHRKTNVNGQPRGASWTSVLENISWSEKANNYRVLRELRATTHQNRLAINLNGFGYYYTHTDGRFSLGRLLGSIGPWYEDEPLTFTAERRLYGVNKESLFTASNFKLNRETQRLSIDFGNSFPISDPLGDVAYDLKLLLGYANTPLSTPVGQKSNPILPKSAVTLLGPLQYKTGDWLLKTGGIVDIENAPAALGEKQLLLLLAHKDQYMLLAREAISGYNVRADQMVLRLDTHDTQEVNFYARQWGQKLSDHSIDIQLQAATKPSQGPICPIPGTGHPQGGVSFSTKSIQLTDGRGTFHITGNAIHSPRGYIDGQIYFVGYGLKNIASDDANAVGDAISIHLRDEFAVPQAPKWADIQEIMQQFSNLYPIMSKYIVDLGDREAVLAKKDILIFAFSQPIHSPIYMPVTRDLSESKRQTILAWLKSDGQYDSEVIAAASKQKAMPSESPEMVSETPELVKQLNMMMKMKMAQSAPELEIEPHNLFVYA